MVPDSSSFVRSIRGIARGGVQRPQAIRRVISKSARKPVYRADIQLDEMVPLCETDGEEVSLATYRLRSLIAGEAVISYQANEQPIGQARL